MLEKYNIEAVPFPKMLIEFSSKFFGNIHYFYLEAI